MGKKKGEGKVAGKGEGQLALCFVSLLVCSFDFRFTSQSKLFAHFNYYRRNIKNN